jgi:tubulin polyglutamylase TTLL6/13
MCKYECVRRAAKRLNFREVSDDDDWNVYWTDTSVGIERVAQMKKWQVRRSDSFFLCFRKSFFAINRKLIIFPV